MFIICNRNVSFKSGPLFLCSHPLGVWSSLSSMFLRCNIASWCFVRSGAVALASVSGTDFDYDFYVSLSFELYTQWYSYHYLSGHNTRYV